MKITIYRGTHELGGTLIELKSGNSRILLDAGYPLFLDGKAIDDGIAVLPVENLLELGVLPKIEGLYNWDKAGFDALIISHSHIDHYGLLPYVHPDIPVYLSEGTARIIRISQTFKIVKTFQVNQHRFTMYLHFRIGDFRIKPFLMDHSAFDAAAFEISCEGKTVIYSGDYRGHGRKAVCLDCLISGAKKNADLLLVEGSTLGRVEEESLTEEQLEQKAKGTIEKADGIVLFQCSSQNIDRLVSFYKATIASGRTLVVDVYTANVLHELRQLGNNLPYPSNNYPGIKVFFPYRLTNKIFKIIGEEYAKQFAAFHISRETLIKQQNNIVMIVRPSMLMDLKKCAFKAGVFIYSMWGGYRNSEYQQKMEKYLLSAGFHDVYLHTSGHASVADIKKLIAGIHPKKIVPIHTMHPAMFLEYSDKVALQEDGIEFKVD